MIGLTGVTNHARARAAEYYGADMPDDAWRAAVLDIIEGRALLLSRSDGKQTEIYAVNAGPLAIRVAWAPERACIVTVLPEGTAFGPRHAAIRAGKVRASVTSAARVGWSKGERRKPKTYWNKGREE